MLTKVLMNQKTWCFGQLKKFYTTSLLIFRELGTWALEYYISQVLGRAMRLVGLENNYLEGCTDAEQRHLCGLLRPIDSVCKIHESSIDASTVSDKVQQFIEALPRDRALAGIVFVQRRATAAVLTQVLLAHPKTKSLYRVGTVVGASHHSLKSTNICDLIEREEQGQTLLKFRSGQLDLVIATTVLEEGIDVPKKGPCSDKGVAISVDAAFTIG